MVFSLDRVPHGCRLNSICGTEVPNSTGLEIRFVGVPLQISYPVFASNIELFAMSNADTIFAWKDLEKGDPDRDAKRNPEKNGVHTLEAELDDGSEAGPKRSPLEGCRTFTDCYNRGNQAFAKGESVFRAFLYIHAGLLFSAQYDIQQLEAKWWAASHEYGAKHFPEWTREDLEELKYKIKDYCTACKSLILILDEALERHQKVLNWNQPSGRSTKYADEFFHGGDAYKPMQYATVQDVNGQSLSYDVGWSDYVDLCPENSTSLGSLLRKFTGQIGIDPSTGAIMKYFQNQNEGRALKFIDFADELVGTTIALLHRILISLFSVMFLIIPMISLTYIRPTGFRLLGASLFSSLFAVFVAMYRTKPQDIFASTAAYAAVLVVFVGSASG